MWPEVFIETAKRQRQSPKDVHFGAFVQNYAIDRDLAYSGDRRFARMTMCGEIHTNDPRYKKKSSVERALNQVFNGFWGHKRFPAQWLNLQGPGISDEYPANTAMRKSVYGNFLDVMFAAPMFAEHEAIRKKGIKDMSITSKRWRINEKRFHDQVESIVDHKLVGGRMFFKLHWIWPDSKQDSWMPAACVAMEEKDKVRSYEGRHQLSPPKNKLKVSERTP